VAARSKAWVCGRSLTRIVGSIPPEARMSVSCECRVLSGRGLCDELVPRPEESYRMWCVWLWSWSVVKWRGLGPQGAVEPLGEKIIIGSSVHKTESGVLLDEVKTEPLWQVIADAENSMKNCLL
jgi:hypothetical protein